MAIQTVNPATGELIQAFSALGNREIEEKLERAARAFKAYRKTRISERAGWLSQAADILEAESERWGRLMTLEMGKPLQAAIDEARKCATACRYYVENGEKYLSDRAVQTQAERSFIRYEPWGPVLAIMPWNFPFWQVFRFAAPALMAGNVGLLKHASNVPRSSLAIEEIFRRAGFPDGVFQSLLITAEQAEKLLDDPRIRAATLTGSDAAGSAVAERAGRNIKKTVLELGGSDPFIVMPSADFEQAVEVAVAARIINNGQSCIAAKRFIVHEKIADRFESEFASRMKALRVGDPMDRSTQLGPLAMPQTVEALERIVSESVRRGARLVTGGKRIPRSGNFYEPTVLADIPREAPAYSEEVFGPVALLFRARDLSHALELANSSRFGLGASIWTADRGEQERFIDEIESGLAFVNGMVASDARLPFGGVKSSGFGRELGEIGIHEFVNIKTVSIKQLSRERLAKTE